MTKTLFLTALLLSALAAAPVQAQYFTEQDLNAMGGTVDPSGAGAATPAAPVGGITVRGGAPINLRPGAYISRMDGMPPGMMEDPNTQKPRPVTAPSGAKTSASAYNAGLKQAQSARQQLTAPKSLIPSPFPEGW